MQEYTIVETPEFTKQFNKIPVTIKKRFIRQLEEVKYDPYSRGKPLGRTWFRELKQEKYRLYYLIAKQKLLILLVRTSDKKHQHETITLIKEEIDHLLSFLNEKTNNISDKTHTKDNEKRSTH